VDDLAARGVTALEPIRREYLLRCSPVAAFEVYTARIGDWWDPRYTVNAETLETVVIEPRVGGRVFARHVDVGVDDWGEVTVWEPGYRLVHTFTLAQDAAHPSEVAVEFVRRAAGGCTVLFAHGGWTDANVGIRSKFGDWRVLLDRFVALAEAQV
jgi:Activator of Hsp90 ATPase homolog 1-like protein